MWKNNQSVLVFFDQVTGLDLIYLIFLLVYFYNCSLYDNLPVRPPSFFFSLSSTKSDYFRATQNLSKNEESKKISFNALLCPRMLGSRYW